jgi:hypothetical protein
VARRIDLTDDELVLRYDGFSRAAVMAGEVRVPFTAIRSVTVGYDDLPGALTWRVGTNTAPFGNTRRGTFWSGGRRLFLDVDDPERTVVLDLEGHRFARVALTVDDPEGFAAQLRERVSPGRRP